MIESKTLECLYNVLCNVDLMFWRKIYDFHSIFRSDEL